MARDDMELEDIEEWASKTFDEVFDMDLDEEDPELEEQQQEDYISEYKDEAFQKYEESIKEDILGEL